MITFAAVAFLLIVPAVIAGLILDEVYADRSEGDDFADAKALPIVDALRIPTRVEFSDASLERGGPAPTYDFAGTSA